MSEEHRYQHQCNADLATRAMLRQEGRELEQERIIKMLERIAEHGTECLMCGNDCSAERLIALIEGEK